MAEENKINLNLDFESIVPWNGQQDTGRDVRLKLDRNWKKVVDAFNTLLNGEFLDDKYLRKDKDDRSTGIIASDKGFEAGNLVKGATGAGVYKNADGQWVIETDNLSVRRKLSAREVEIQTTHHIGGQTLLSAASMSVERVEVMNDRYRCYFRKKDGEGNIVRNQWKVGDLAFCNTFNLEKQADGTVGNHTYWREVAGVSTDAYSEEWHYVDLSISKCALDSSEPKSGDKVVQLGYSKDDDAERQNAIVIAGAGTGSPYIQLFVGINSFVLPEPEQLKPGDNRLSGRLIIKEGSTGWQNLEGLPDSIQEALTMSEEAKNFVESQEYGKNNLLRNSGFTGDYVTASLQEGDVLTGGSDMFSPSLVHWISDGATPMESDVSESGKEVMLISGGSLRQVIPNKVMVGESYVFSFRGRGIGSLTFSFGGYTKNIGFNSEDWELYVEKFVATDENRLFTIEAYEDCFLCELQLERGTLRSAWGISPLDNRSELAKYESLRYMSDTIEKGSTDVFGGLILTNMMLMKNLENKVTSGSSGVYSDDNSVAYFAGGDMEAAVRTAMAYMDDPTYQPTQEELDNMAKYVVTHGGRAILNDVILRGYIYALGGLFKGSVDIANGKIKLNNDGSGKFANGNIAWKDNGVIYRKANDVIKWSSIQEYVDRVVDYKNGTYLDLTLNSISDEPYVLSDPIDDEYVITLRFSMASRSQSCATLSGNFKIKDPSEKKFDAYDSAQFLTLSKRNKEYLLYWKNDAWYYHDSDAKVENGVAYLGGSVESTTTVEADTVKANIFYANGTQGLTTNITINGVAAYHTLTFTGGILTGYERTDRNE